MHGVANARAVKLHVKNNQLCPGSTQEFELE
jgi:hypothetical protein